MSKTAEALQKVNKIMETVDAHRKRAMLVGYYLYHTSDLSDDYRIRDMSYEAVDTLQHGFSRRKLREVQRQTGLDRVLKIRFKKS